MGQKYFETKEGSLEAVSTKIAQEQPTIKKQEPNVKLERKTYFENKPGSLEDLASKVVSEGLDPVNKVAVKKDFADRKDKDIDNDGDTDSTDKYLHKRRQAISKNIKEKAISTKGATRKPTSASDRLYLSNPNEHRRRQELEFMYKRILASMPEKERNSKEGKIQAMDLARVRSAKNKKDLAKNLKNKGTLKIAEDLGKEDEPKVKKIIGKLKKASDAHAGQAKDLQKAMTEDDMAKFHKMQKDGKSAEQIAKALDIDVKSTKKLMDSVMPDDKGEFINKKKHDAAQRGEKKPIDPEPKIKQIIKGEKETTRANGHMTKKKFSEMRIKLGKNGKTETGQDAPAVETEPKAERI